MSAASQIRNREMGSNSSFQAKREFDFVNQEYSKSGRNLLSLTPVKKTGSSVASKLSPSRQFLYISLSICAGLVLFFLILFACYKIYEYFNPSEKTTTDTIDFMEELEDIEEKEEEKVPEEVPEEEKVTEE